MNVLAKTVVRNRDPGITRTLIERSNVMPPLGDILNYCLLSVPVCRLLFS
jgi:hypothetical protein